VPVKFNSKPKIVIKQNLQKIFANNPHLFVQDFQGIIAEDGQLYMSFKVSLLQLSSRLD
jgi:hypothetical protein